MTPIDSDDSDEGSASIGDVVTVPSNDGWRLHDSQGFAWSLRDGLRLLRRRPRTWIAVLLLLFGSAELQHIGLLVAKQGVAKWLVVGSATLLSLALRWYADLILMRILVGELARGSLSWRSAQRWALARMDRKLRFTVIVLVMGTLLIFLEILVGVATGGFHGNTMALYTGPWLSFLVVTGFFLALRWPNIETYYIVLEENFMSSIRHGYREAGRQLRSYVLPATLVSLPSILNYMPQITGPTTTANTELWPWRLIIVQGLTAIISPVLSAAYLLLWLRHGGEMATLAAFERKRT